HARHDRAPARGRRRGDGRDPRSDPARRSRACRSRLALVSLVLRARRPRSRGDVRGADRAARARSAQRTVQRRCQTGGGIHRDGGRAPQNGARSLMRRAVWRYATLALALLFVWLVVLGFAAHVPWSAAWSPRRHLSLTGSEFQSIFGDAAVADHSL